VKPGKSSREWSFRIHDILQAIDKIEHYLQDMTLIQFRKNELVIDAVIRNFEIIGEVSKNIPDHIQFTFPDIPWKRMNGMRNILIHEYFGVDVDTIWHTAKKQLPTLKRALLHLVCKE
jgi:uncharacterized protein with HEPN domain